MTIGVAALATGIYMHSEKYSNQAIWKRQIPVIERHIRARTSPEKNKAKYKELRDKLETLGSSTPERCEFEQRFEAEIITGSKEKADDLFYKKNFEPFSDCKTIPQIKHSAGQWYGILGIVGAAVALWSALSLIASFANRRREYYPRENGDSVPPVSSDQG